MVSPWNGRLDIISIAEILGNQLWNDDKGRVVLNNLSFTIYLLEVWLLKTELLQSQGQRFDKTICGSGCLFCSAGLCLTYVAYTLWSRAHRGGLFIVDLKNAFDKKRHHFFSFFFLRKCIDTRVTEINRYGNNLQVRMQECRAV